MKNAIINTFFFLVLFGTAFNFAVYAQDKQEKKLLPDTFNGLQIKTEIIGDKKKFRKSDTFWILIKLKNVGNSPIILYKHMTWGLSSSFYFRIHNEYGEYVKQSVIEDSIAYLLELSKEDFETIKPGELIERKRDVILEEFAVDKPGIYSFRVSFESPMFPEYVPKGMTVRTINEGVINSKPVKFEIIK